MGLSAIAAADGLLYMIGDDPVAMGMGCAGAVDNGAEAGGRLVCAAVGDSDRANEDAETGTVTGGSDSSSLSSEYTRPAISPLARWRSFCSFANFACSANLARVPCPIPSSSCSGSAFGFAIDSIACCMESRVVPMTVWGGRVAASGVT